MCKVQVNFIENLIFINLITYFFIRMADKLDFEKDLWKVADKLRGKIEASEYKHIVFGMIFLKYVSDSFEHRVEVLREKYKGDEELDLILQDRDYYEGSFYLPEKATWKYLSSKTEDTTLPTLLDDAMVMIEENNQTLKGITPKVYVRSGLNYETLGQIIDLFSKLELYDKGNGDKKEKDIFGRVYEYFLMKFALTEGRRGGEFFTPQSIVKLLVEILEPYKGLIYDPACGSGGMFVQSLKFIEKHHGKKEDISIHGQEAVRTTFNICKMNLAIRHLEGHIALEDTLNEDQFPNKQFDYIIANPPFNLKEWKKANTDNDSRWEFGTVNSSNIDNVNANYYWIQHMYSHLKHGGRAGFVLSNGSLTEAGQEAEIRKKLILADAVDIIVTLPNQLFFTTQIPACLWFLSKNKENREGKVLFVDARKLGHSVSKTQIEFSDEDMKKITDKVRAFRGEEGSYEDEKGFCKVVDLEVIENKNFTLNPGRYVGVEDSDEISKEDFQKELNLLLKELDQEILNSEKIDLELKENLNKLKNGF